MYRILILLIFSTTLGATTLEDIAADARAFSNAQINDIGANIGNLDLPCVEGEPFDAKKALKDVEDGDLEFIVVGKSRDELYRSLNSKDALVDVNEQMFFQMDALDDDIDKVFSGVVISEGIEYTVKKCEKSTESIPIIFERELKLNVTSQPELNEEFMECQGHKGKSGKYSSSKKASKEENKVRSIFASDANIKEFKVWKENGGKKVVWSYKHVDNCSKCSDAIAKIRLLQKGVFKINSEEWVYNNNLGKLAVESEKATKVRYKCIDQGEDGIKFFNGNSVFRPCWKEKLEYIYTPDYVDSCAKLSSQQGTLIEQKCIESSIYGCTKWERIFNIPVKSSSRKVEFGGVDDFYGMHSELDAPEEEPDDNSFQSVAAQMAVFEAVQNELEDKRYKSIEDVVLFKGEALKCRKSIASDIGFDCCFKNSGIALDWMLAKCDTEEISLGMKRDKGHCVKIGSKKIKDSLTGKITVSTDHIYVCFDGKLARIFQTESRKQLGINWGDVEHPNASGISYTDFQKLDFSKMDFSEFYSDIEEKTSSDINDRLENFSDSLGHLQGRFSGTKAERKGDLDV